MPKTADFGHRHLIKSCQRLTRRRENSVAILKPGEGVGAPRLTEKNTSTGPGGPEKSKEKKDKQMNWQLWLKGLAAAAVGGAATGATHAVSTSGGVNQGTAITAAAGALVTVLAYLLKSPLAAQAPPLAEAPLPPTPAPSAK